MATTNNALGINNSPSKTSTIESFIDMGTVDEITYYKFSILVKCLEDSDIQYSQTNIIYDYMEELKGIAVEYELTDNEFTKYKYKPKRLAYDLYGSTEIYFLILAINGMCNIKDFSKKKIKLFYRNDLLNILNEIYAAEQDYIRYNRKSIK